MGRTSFLTRWDGLLTPCVLGPGFREPNPRTWFRPSRASIPFEGKGIA